MPNYICIGVPYYIGERIANRTEVAAIENSGFADEIGAPWITIEPDFAAVPDTLTAVNKALADVIQSHPDRVPLIFASDCCSALGAMKGLEAQSPAVLWYDAHGDFNTPETTPSGFLGGMPLAWLVGRGDMQHMTNLGLSPIAERDVFIADARDLDPGEAAALRESAIAHLPRLDDLLTTPLPDKPVYVHFDTDIVDITDMPGMNYPAPGGPSLEQAVQTARRVAQDTRIAGVLFSLWNDSLPTGGKSLTGVLQIAHAFIGKGS